MAGQLDSKVSFQVGTGNFSNHHCIQNILGVKAAGAWSWPLPSI